MRCAQCVLAWAREYPSCSNASDHRAGHVSARAAMTSGPSSLKQYWIPERGARMARRDDREYREYLREKQRSQPGCPDRKAVLLQRRRATSFAENCVGVPLE